MCPQGLCVGYKLMPSPKGSVRCAQLLMRIAGYAPAQRQGSALHPCWIPCTKCRRSSGRQSGNWARRGELQTSLAEVAGSIGRRC